MDKNKSINALLQEIEDKKILLPEFQRNFTWSVEQTVDLFDSISRNIFIGALILSKPKFALTCRDIDSRPRKGRGKNAVLSQHDLRERDFESKNIFVLLDGQQRATSIYRALKGIDDIYFVLKNSSELPSFSSPIEYLDQIIKGFSSKPDSNHFSISVSQIFKSNNYVVQEDFIKEIVQPTIEEYQFADPNDAASYLKATLHLTKLFHDILKDKTLLSVFLLDMDLEKFCMFFERSNSKGIALSFIDIITAKIYKGFNLRKKKEEFKDKYNDRALEDNQILEAFVRYMSFLEKEQVDKKTILESLDDSHFNKHWDDICALFMKSKNCLISQHLIFNIEWMPNKTMYIPLMHFISCLPNKDFSQATHLQQDFIKFWFWSSMLNTRYGGGMVGSTNDIIVEDCKLLEKIARNQPIKKDALRRFKFDYSQEELLELTSNKSATFIGVMSLINCYYQFKELANNGNISFREETNIHHIFPRKYIEDFYPSDSYEAENVDSILNKMIIGKISNIKFGKKTPSEYLKGKPFDSNNNINRSLESHLIPNPPAFVIGEYDTKFREFIEGRGSLIKELIEDKIINTRDRLIEELEEEAVIN